MNLSLQFTDKSLFSFAIFLHHVTHPCIYLLKTKQHTHRARVQNTPKLNNKDTRTTSTAVALISSPSTSNLPHTLHRHPQR